MNTPEQRPGFALGGVRRAVYDDLFAQWQAQQEQIQALQDQVQALTARDRERRGYERSPVTLLAGHQSMARMRALRRAQDVDASVVWVTLDPTGIAEERVAFGDPALSAAVFALGGALDDAARPLGGEAFELEDALAVVIAASEATTVAEIALQEAERERLDVSVAVTES